MLGSVRARMVLACSLLLLGVAAYAQKAQVPAAASVTSSKRAATMQIKVAVTGSLLYRLIPLAGIATVPVPVPAASSAAPIAAIPLPANMPIKGTTLEVVDTTTGKVAHLPVQSERISELDEGSFTFVQTVLVPVQVQNKGGVTDATVTLTSGPPTYQQQWTLKPADGGVAQFTNVPLRNPVTVKVVNGTDPPFEQTQTLPTNPPADGYRWPTIYVSWPDTHTVAIHSPMPTSAGSATAPAAAPATAPLQPASPLDKLLSVVVSAGLLALLGWGLYTGYQRGHIKKALEGMGVVIPPMESGQPGPPGVQFDSRERVPVVQITEGVVDPLVGVAPGMPQAYTGAPAPKLIGKAGTFTGTIFPLGGPLIQIGRDTSCDVPLASDANVSRRHATITSDGGTFSIADSGSSNGTFLNGTRLAAGEVKPIAPGDEIHIGNTRFRFEV